MKRIVALLAVMSTALLLTTPVMAVPTLSVTADHLGNGLIQYTLTGNNDLGGSVAIEVQATALGGLVFEQRDANVFTFAGGAGFTAPVSTFQLSQAADAFDPAYDNPLTPSIGSAEDTWYDNSITSTANPPYADALQPWQGGADPASSVVGSPNFNFSAGSAAGSNIGVWRIAQLTIVDPAAAALPLGPQTVVAAGSAPFQLHSGSLIASQGASFLIDGNFAIVPIPEPSTFALLGIGLMAFALIRRRR